MKTLSELEELEDMRGKTNLRGEALLAYYEANKTKGEQFFKRHEMKRSGASYCAEIDKYLAEMRFFRESGYAVNRPCLATVRDITLIEKNYGNTCEIVVSILVAEMQVRDAIILS